MRVLHIMFIAYVSNEKIVIYYKIYSYTYNNIIDEVIEYRYYMICKYI